MSVTWGIAFISKEDFKKHVRKTIAHYGEKLEPYDVSKFNKNIIDPVKMIFDKAVYGEDWKTLISNEIFRQRDKSNTNEIGYFHQRLFSYIDRCEVPPNGEKGGWDVIYSIPDGYVLDNGNVVHKIYVEMKNKHNTMNSAAGGINRTPRDYDIFVYAEGLQQEKLDGSGPWSDYSQAWSAFLAQKG